MVSVPGFSINVFNRALCLSLSFEVSPRIRADGLKPADHASLRPSYQPGSFASYAHDWNEEEIGGPIRIEGRYFVDAYNRVCNLRGVNMSGMSKIPVNHDPQTWLDEESDKTVTFVGRPFPLEEADEHLARLRRWGLTFVRFNITWEALEHAGPGEYDYAYLDYLHAVLSKFPLFGLTAFLSLHQDVWSRFSGGSGAPAWTLRLVGFDLKNLVETGAAYLEGVEVPGRKETDRGRWPTGYQKLAAATMATVFWGGETFAPKLVVERNGEQVSAQRFLQDAFLACYEVLAEKVGQLPAVLGFQLMNEPHRGYISLPTLYDWDYNTDLHLHDFPSPLASFALGAGHSIPIPHYVRSFPFPTRHSGHTLCNDRGVKAWREDGATGGRCLWEWHGVWGWDKAKEEAVPLREHYFMRHPVTDKPVDWYNDLYFPFALDWAHRVQARAGNGKLVFVEPIPNEFCPSWPAELRPPNFVYAPHWYDLNALFKKEFGSFSVNVQGLSRGMFILRALYWGHAGAKKNYAVQLKNVIESAYTGIGEVPVVVGECGVPMDLNDAEAFRTGDFSWQSRMMDALISGLDSARASFTLWNYNPHNTDTDGDFWNGENFSWFGLSQRRDAPRIDSLGQTNDALDDGGRILESVVRPYPAKVAGIPLHYAYDSASGRFELEYANPSPSPNYLDIRCTETEVFVPHMLTDGRQLLVSGADNWSYDQRRQTLYIVQQNAVPGHIHSVEVLVEPPLMYRLKSEPFAHIGVALISLIVLLIAIWIFRDISYLS